MIEYDRANLIRQWTLWGVESFDHIYPLFDIFSPLILENRSFLWKKQLEQEFRISEIKIRYEKYMQSHDGVRKQFDDDGSILFPFN